MIQNSLYHSLLRISSLTLALVLLFDSGVLSPATKILSDNTYSYVANSIGVQASVEATDLNRLTAEVTAQKQALENREVALAEREIAVGIAETEGSRNSDFSTLLLSFILFILLVLIILNYVLDYLRATDRTRAVKTS